MSTSESYTMGSGMPYMELLLTSVRNM